MLTAGRLAKTRQVIDRCRHREGINFKDGGPADEKKGFLRWLRRKPVWGTTDSLPYWS